MFNNADDDNNDGDFHVPPIKEKKEIFQEPYCECYVDQKRCYRNIPSKLPFKCFDGFKTCLTLCKIIHFNQNVIELGCIL